MRRHLPVVLPIALALATLSSVAPSLSRQDRRVVAQVRALHEEQVGYLARVVDIPSGTMNLEGVRRVGAVFEASLDSLGFDARWVPMDATGRAGHLVAEHRGRSGRKRV